MSNFRPLVHPLLIDFGGGSSSCSCCCCCSCSCSCSCDRGKTKSTPSPKTEVWTLDLGLEFDNIDHRLLNLFAMKHASMLKYNGGIGVAKLWLLIFSGGYLLVTAKVASSIFVST